MPIQADPDGTLDIENATLRSRGIVALTNMVAGNDVVRSGGPALEVYGDPGPRLELVSNTAATDGTATFTRLESNVGVFSIQSGEDASTNGPITFGGFANERMRIDADGNVGIGTTDPLEYIHIQYPNPAYGSLATTEHANVVISSGTEFSDAGLFFRTPFDATSPPKCALIASGSNFSGSSGQLDICFNTTDNNDTVHRATPANAKVTFKADGSVGIGTTDPLSPLDIKAKKGILTATSLQNLYSNASVMITGTSESADALCIGMLSTDTVGNSGNNPYAYIQNIWDQTVNILAQPILLNPAGGNVGIGTTDPKTMLHVNHDLHLQASTEGWNATAGKGLYLRYSTSGGQDAAYIQSIDRTNTSLSYPMIFQGSSYQFSVGNVVFDGNVTTGPILYVGTNDNSTTAKTIYFGGTYGDNSYDHCVIERRIWQTGSENQELLLFSGNDTDPGSGSDRIRMKGNTILFDTYSSATTDRVAETTRMKIDQEGGLGLGTTAPDFHLTIKGAQKIYNNLLAHIYLGNDYGGWGMLTDNTSAGANGWNHNLNWYGRTNAAGNPFQKLVMFENDSDNQTDTGVVQSFTGQHRCFMENVTDETAITYEGLIVSANRDRYINLNGPALETGLNAIRVSESIPLVSISQIPKDKTCFGVISSVEDPETREERSGRVVSSFTKECGDTRIFVNSIGEGAIWVTNMNGNLESGDYITTSTLAGYGQKQDTEFLANYTVAKITMGCDFNPATQPVKRLKKELRDVKYWVKTVYESVSKEEYSNLIEENRTTTTETVYTNGEGEITTERYNTLETTVQSTYSELSRIIYQKVSKETSTIEQNGWELEISQEMVNILNEYGQIQWEDDPSGATEKAYKIRYLDADGNITDEANHVYKAAFVGCTYHCG